MTNHDIAFIAELETIVRTRIESPGEESYTARLIAKGTKRIAQKVGEEGVELALAAQSGDRDETIDEAADLLYHMIVLLTDQGIQLSEVADRLESRHSSRTPAT
ncbi:MAG: phosphoribosyl-ATP diphosphatase [Gammaproteobacteria bacterium]|nr:phosphoribosyl-ATP diphosphatase [Gammaproteobacteria bacterium]